MDQKLTVKEAIQKIISTLDTIEVKGSVNLQSVLLCRSLAIACLQSFEKPVEPIEPEVTLEEVPEEK